MTEPSPFLAADQTPVDAAHRGLDAEGAAMSVDQVVAYALGDRPWPAP